MAARSSNNIPEAAFQVNLSALKCGYPCGQHRLSFSSRTFLRNKLMQVKARLWNWEFFICKDKASLRKVPQRLNISDNARTPRWQFRAHRFSTDARTEKRALVNNVVRSDHSPFLGDQKRSWTPRFTGSEHKVHNKHSRRKITGRYFRHCYDIAACFWKRNTTGALKVRVWWGHRYEFRTTHKNP